MTPVSSVVAATVMLVAKLLGGQSYRLMLTWTGIPGKRVLGGQVAGIAPWRLVPV